MPWKEQRTMSLRREVVGQMLQEGTNVSALCRKTAYKWLRRYREGGWEALQDLPRRPRESPHQTPQEVEDAVLAIRQAHPAWGARKIHASLLGDIPPQTTSTIPACASPGCFLW
ncbi:MAG: helix-turn-helix domain-containing protein [Anaerolineae bacterium]|nr:helix-turn-helix domain-containing protein [Anaerolineae bacterium]